MKPVRTFFIIKYWILRLLLGHSHPPLSCSLIDLLTFNPISSVQLVDIVFKVQFPSCESVIPAHHFKEVFAALCPAIMAIVNNSLANEIVPASFKHALVQHLHKKALDRSILCNFRPISKMPFISKLLERVVYS